MSRLSNKFFTGGVQNRVQSSVRDPGASGFSATTVLPATPTVRPTSSSRRGTTFAGSVAGALPNASPNEQTFGAVQSNGPGRDTFGKRGERAANQDVKNYNAIAESFNANATSAKQAEIQAYEQEVARLNSQYNTQLNSYNSLVNGINSDYDQALAQYQQDISGYQNRQVDIRNLNGKYTNYKFYGDLLSGAYTGNFASIRTPADRQLYQQLYNRSKYEFESLQQYLNQQYPNQSRFFTGAFSEDQLGEAPVKASLPPGTSPPSTPQLPSPPSTIVEQRQMQEMLPEVVQRRLANGQREAINGSLPPQVAATTGSTFSQQDINYGTTPLREISELNQQQQQVLGLPKAYRVNAGFTAQAGNNTSYGGQTFTPDQIGNQTATAYFVKGGIGWIPKSNVTSLY